MKGDTMNMQYYKCISLIGDAQKITYWRTNKPIFLINTYDFIIPLGTHKPRNVANEDIKQG